MVVVRENTEGEYAAQGGIFREGTPDAVALQPAMFTHKGCERVMRYAFELARRRSKALNYSMVFWDRVLVLGVSGSAGGSRPAAR